MKQSTATWTKGEISRTDARLRSLSAEADRLERARKLLLIANDDREKGLRDAIKNGVQHREFRVVRTPGARELLKAWSGRGLHSIEEEMEELRERRELLLKQLPSANEVAKADREAAELLKRAAEQRKAFEDAWSVFVASLMEVAPGARQVATTRRMALATIQELRDIKEQYALDIDVPWEPKLDPANLKVARLLVLLCHQAAHSLNVSQETEHELESAKAVLKQVA